MLKPLILFTGPDASGKSTLAYLLRGYLEKKGFKTKIVRLRGTHTLSYILMRLMRDALKLHGNDLHYYKVKIPKKFIVFWLYIEMLSVLPLIATYYYLARVKYVIISERSVIDVIIWLITGINDNIQLTLFSKPIKLLLLLATKYRNKTFYITAEIHELIFRKPADKMLVLKTFPHYNAFATCLKLRTINTSHYNPLECLELLTNWLII